MQEFNFVSLVPLVIIILIFYFLIIRPQQSQRKKHAAMVKELKRGDKIVTNGGFLCEVISQEETYILVRLGSDSVKLSKDFIAYKVDNITQKEEDSKKDKAEKIEHKKDKQSNEQKSEN